MPDKKLLGGARLMQALIGRIRMGNDANSTSHETLRQPAGKLQ